MTTVKYPRLIGPRVLVDPLWPESELEKIAERSKLILVTAEVNKPKPTQGKVVAVGNDPLLLEVCKVGDNVFFRKHSGQGMMIAGKQYLLLDISEVESVLDEGVQIETPPPDDAG